MEANEGTKDGNRYGREDGAGTEMEVKIRGRTQNGNGDGSEDGNEGSRGDGDGDEKGNGDVDEDRIGRAEERRRSARNRTRVVNAMWNIYIYIYGKTSVERETSVDTKVSIQ